jgi:hypothetical protein
MKKETLEIIKNIDFHDLTVSNLNIDLKEKKISCTFDEYDELGDDYFPMTLTFEEVSQFLIDYPQEVSFELDSVLKAEFKELANNDMAEFTFSMGFSKPICTLTIHFTSLTVKRTLSSTAIDFKKANLESRYEKMEWFEKNNLPVPEWV